MQSEHQIPKIVQSRLNSMNGGHDWYEDAISRLASDSQGIKPSDSTAHEVQRASQDEIPAMIAHDNGVDTRPDQPCVVRLSDIDYQILQLRAAFQLPPRSIRESLNDSFMERCYPWMPIIERSWLEEGEERRISALLVQAVFLAASRVSSSPTVAAFASPRDFYQRAKTLFWTGHEQDALMTIRAACILNWYIPHGPEQVSFDTGKFCKKHRFSYFAPPALNLPLLSLTHLLLIFLHAAIFTPFALKPTSIRRLLTLRCSRDPNRGWSRPSDRSSQRAAAREGKHYAKKIVVESCGIFLPPTSRRCRGLTWEGT
jgi:hypothetical protein